MLQKDPAKRLSSSNLKKNIEKLNNSIQIKNDLNGFINILENKNAEYSDDFISNIFKWKLYPNRTTTNRTL